MLQWNEPGDEDSLVSIMSPILDLANHKFLEKSDLYDPSGELIFYKEGETVYAGIVA